jgi:hypothetical protein
VRDVLATLDSELEPLKRVLPLFRFQNARSPSQTTPRRQRAIYALCIWHIAAPSTGNPYRGLNRTWVTIGEQACPLGNGDSRLPRKQRRQFSEYSPTHS